MNNNELITNLLHMKEKIDKAKEKKANLEGKIESLLDQLKQEFNCNSFEEASTKSNVLEQEIHKEKQELNQAIERIQNDFDWDKE